ncbi:esterase/lipase family protein [Corallincola platygyrae]|uniref:Esterase/lipase family protein n=1 Tax=Corallincola platygyrae TaxID=1193278 RepID=A0ABW4XLW5_9GAMM
MAGLILHLVLLVTLVGGGVTAFAQGITSLSKGNEKQPSECVVLLHGLGKSARSMQWLSYELSQSYQVANISYPSLSKPIEQLAAPTVEAGLQQCRGLGADRVHFVTHSMGGILLRHYLAHHEISSLGRVVMLGPPNQGSEIIDQLQQWEFVADLLGPAGNQLSTIPTSVPNSLGAVEFELGVIAGNQTVNPILSLWLPDADDGKVSVERAQVEGMSDFLVVDASHPLLMWRPDVTLQVEAFLQTGHFSVNPATDHSSDRAERSNG